MERGNNYVQLCGVMAGRPELSHVSRGEAFYRFTLAAERLSGSVDTINIIVRQKMLENTGLSGGKLMIEGELRSFNNRSGNGAKLVISVLAREIGMTDEADMNFVSLEGTLCKTPKLRSTPMGRDICDLMVAVNRSYGRSDYLPCICWGTTAREAALWDVGDRIRLEGRIQSRRYIKIVDDAAQERIAFEVSASSAELICN